MEAKLYNSAVYVNMADLKMNIHSIIHSLPNCVECIPVLKGNAYGLGLVPIAKAISSFPEITTIALAQVSEALLLRQNQITQELLILGSMPSAHIPEAVANDLTITVGRPGMLPQIQASAKALGRQARIQLKLDTGLHRIGFCPGPDLDVWIQEFRQCGPEVRLTGVFSQFTDAETVGSPFCQDQYALFLQGIEQLQKAGINPPCKHVCNSAASEWLQPLPGDAVRVGRRLFMDSQNAPLGNIREVASWRTTITCLHHLHAGDTVGYGRHIAITRDTTVATLAVGYGDGLNIQVANRQGPVLVGGRRAPLLGTCMDQCFVDVTGIDCQVDDEVTFFGYDRDGNFLSSQEVAALANDEGCGLTQALTDRVARIYL